MKRTFALALVFLIASCGYSPQQETYKFQFVNKQEKTLFVENLDEWALKNKFKRFSNTTVAHALERDTVFLSYINSNKEHVLAMHDIKGNNYLDVTIVTEYLNKELYDELLLLIKGKAVSRVRLDAPQN